MPDVPYVWVHPALVSFVSQSNYSFRQNSRTIFEDTEFGALDNYMICNQLTTVQFSTILVEGGGGGGVGGSHLG